MGLYKEGEESAPPAKKPENAAPENAAPAVAQEGAPPPKRRGRPPGSKNRKAGETGGTETLAIDLGSLPDEVIEPLALAPLIIADKALQAKTRERNADGSISFPGISLDFDKKSAAAAIQAFRKWLSSIDVNLTPGWAYIGAMGVCFVSAAPAAMMALKEHAEKKEAEVKANPEAMSTPPATGNPNADKPSNSDNGTGASSDSAS